MPIEFEFQIYFVSKVKPLATTVVHAHIRPQAESGFIKKTGSKIEQLPQLPYNVFQKFLKLYSVH